MPKAAHNRSTDSRAARIGNAVVGVFFVAIAAWLVVIALPLTSIGEPVVALVMGSLGADALRCAIIGRRSLLSRLGPLP
jgi:hypothetical protein